MRATMTGTLLKLDKYFLHPLKLTVINAAFKSLFLHAQIGSAIMTALTAQNVLLPPLSDIPAIMINEKFF
jgi:hypothetical protein